MNDSFKGATGKLCGHSDTGATYIGRTGKTYSHKRCNNRDLEALPYSDKEIKQHASFLSRSTVINETIKLLTDDQRQVLRLLRNREGKYSIRELIESIYDKSTNSIPENKFKELFAKAKRTEVSSVNGNVNGGSGNSGDDENESF